MSEWVSVLLVVPLLLAGVMVVFSRDIVRSILWLGLVLGWTAALYASMDAGFIAAVQLLLYAGGVVTLMIVGVMVTERSGGVAPDDRRSRFDVRAAITALSTFALMAFAFVRTSWPSAATPPPPLQTSRIGEALLGEHMVAFELLSLLLLAGMLGAIALVRKVSAVSAVRTQAVTTAATEKRAA